MVSLAISCSWCQAQEVVPVGKGSYASFIPAGGCKDPAKVMSTAGLCLAPSAAKVPIPSNQWWTDLIFQKYCGDLWAHPLVVSAGVKGVKVSFPQHWNADGSHMELDHSLVIGGEVKRVADPRDHLIGDFEGAAYGPGWIAEGSAFSHGPAKGRMPGQTGCEGYLGKGLASSFFNGDASTGTLASPTFTISSRNLHFLIGGGRDEQRLKVELLVGGQPVLHATGKNSETLTWEMWDVSRWKGQSGRIRVTDQTTGGWGHIMVDHFVLSDDATIPADKLDSGFRPVDARALEWGDWTVAFRLAHNTNEFMDVTVGHGLPYAWIETRGVVPVIQGDADAAAFDGRGQPLAWPLVGDHFGMEQGGRAFGIMAPPQTRFSMSDSGIKVEFSGHDTYLIVAALPNRPALEFFYRYAYAMPRGSRIDWEYDPVAATVKTRWHLETVPLRGTDRSTIQGWIPHHYRETRLNFAFNGQEFHGVRGLMKCATGQDFEITWPFSGIVPVLPAPRTSGGSHDYLEARMMGYVTNYARRTDYGGDTYWGGKHLLQFAMFMAMAHEIGQTTAAETLRQSVRKALSDWYTYTPGEKEHYFARYDQWGALVGFHSSYGSEEFTDNHFHYGYFTAATGLLGFYDPAFLADYGGMARLVAKQYANWEREDKRFPFLRTFDIWEGHSWAGGHSSGGGNNQESSSEAMQSWGGLFWLGSALHDAPMTAVGAMGYAMESEAVREYWFDVHHQNLPSAYKHSITGIFFDGGQAYATYFSGDPAWIHGIQWLPVSPILNYLVRDPAFARQDFQNMMRERKEKEGKDDIASLGSGLGNVVLSYAAQFDPDWTAQKMDELWDANQAIAHENDTAGITYYLTHANRMLGLRRWDMHMDCPTSVVYSNAATHIVTYCVFNPDGKPRKITVYEGNRRLGSLMAPGGKLSRVTALSPEGVTP